MTKIFVIGFNKCATTSLHHLFQRSGIASLHFRAPGVGNAGLRMKRNLRHGRPLLTGMEGFTAYSDFNFANHRGQVEGARLFRQLHAEHPEAHFILNTRDEEAWLASRFAHMGGSLAERGMAAHGTDADGLRRIWRRLWRRHHAEVRNHFAGNPRFLEFHIERDPPERLADFLAPEHAVDPAHWKRRNRTRRRVQRH